MKMEKDGLEQNTNMSINNIWWLIKLGRKARLKECTHSLTWAGEHKENTRFRETRKLSFEHIVMPMDIQVGKRSELETEIYIINLWMQGMRQDETTQWKEK